MERSPSLPKPSFPRRRHPAPDYSSRRSQIRLLVLVFALLAMLRVADEARRPENWQWFVAMQSPESTAGTNPRVSASDSTQPTIDTRPPMQAAPENPDVPVIRTTDNLPTAGELGRSPSDHAAQNALLNGWTAVWERLSNSQQDQLSRGLWTHRQGGIWGDDERLAWPTLALAVRAQWTAYLDRLQQNLEHEQTTLTPAQQKQCREVIAQLAQTADGQMAALQALAEPTTPSPDQSAALESLQKTLDTRAWNAVEDNTVLRSADNEAWNRTWELLASPEATRVAEPVSFVQLFAQSEVYRGRAVQVRGTARLGYQVKSRSERQGIHGYYVLWLRPADGSETPMVVYVASLPVGFPALTERTPLSDGTALREEVTVTGLHFKRWLYGSQGGPNLAPLILGKITDWSRGEVNSASKGYLMRRAPAVWVLSIAVLFVACGLIGWMVSRRPRGRPGPARDTSAETQLRHFDTTAVRGSVSESLQTLHREANDEH
jgi:hypothetical protein